MIEKRFTIADYPDDIVDNQTGEKYRCSSYATHIEIIRDLLNELSEENEQLKSELDNCKECLDLNRSSCARHMKENEQLKSDLKTIEEHRKIENEQMARMEEEIKDYQDTLARMEERLQIKDYALQKQLEVTANQQKRIKELEDDR